MTKDHKSYSAATKHPSLIEEIHMVPTKDLHLSMLEAAAGLPKRINKNSPRQWFQPPIWLISMIFVCVIGLIIFNLSGFYSTVSKLELASNMNIEPSSNLVAQQLLPIEKARIEVVSNQTSISNSLNLPVSQKELLNNSLTSKIANLPIHINIKRSKPAERMNTAQISNENNETTSPQFSVAL